jgi:hypothetical protein
MPTFTAKFAQIVSAVIHVMPTDTANFAEVAGRRGGTVAGLPPHHALPHDFHPGRDRTAVSAITATHYTLPVSQLAAKRYLDAPRTIFSALGTTANVMVPLSGEAFVHL